MRQAGVSRLAVAGVVFAVIAVTETMVTAGTPAKNGTTKWQFGTGAYIQGSPTLAADGTVYIGSGPPVDKLFALSPEGKVKRFKGRPGRRNDVKKAYVTLEEGNMVDVSTNL